MIFTDEEGNKYEVHSTMPMVDKEYLVIKPVKKTEHKEQYSLMLFDDRKDLIKRNLDLTPTTANKLSEAISALVEYVTTGKGSTDKLTIVATEALQEYWESQ
jgi:hypothetical protein